MFDVQKTLYSAVQYFLIIYILFLNLMTMPLVEGISYGFGASVTDLRPRETDGGQAQTSDFRG